MNWSERFLDSGIVLAIVAAAIRFFQPAVFDYIAYAFGKREAVIKKKIEVMFATEIAKYDAMSEIVSSHKDILEFIVESVKRTNHEMPQMVSVLDRVADSVDRLTETCEKLNEGQTATQEALGRLDERTKMWERLHAMDLQRAAESGRIPHRISDSLAP